MVPPGDPGLEADRLSTKVGGGDVHEGSCHSGDCVGLLGSSGEADDLNMYFFYSSQLTIQIRGP